MVEVYKILLQSIFGKILFDSESSDWHFKILSVMHINMHETAC